MIEDVFVIDSVAHGYNLRPDNVLDAYYGEKLGDALYYGFHVARQPKGEPQWLLDRELFDRSDDAEFLNHMFFAESQVDLAVYHNVPLFGIWRDGGSPIEAGIGMRDRAPDRVKIFGGISPWQPNALDEIDRLVDEVKVDGIKFYPMDVIDGKIHSYGLDDPELAFPLIERIQAKGLTSIAVHKAYPIGPVPLQPFNVTDIEGAAMAFPKMNFEIVHGGAAFLEETALHLSRFPNVLVNLEATSSFLVDRPRLFAQVLGTFMRGAGSDRIVWATGAVLSHPRSLIELFWDWQMPADMTRDFGYPQVTREDKAKILGLNQARYLNIDIDAVKNKIADDEYSRKTELAAPWSGQHSEMAAG